MCWFAVFRTSDLRILGSRLSLFVDSADYLQLSRPRRLIARGFLKRVYGSVKCLNDHPIMLNTGLCRMRRCKCWSAGVDAVIHLA
jgi:hypothetical protein